MAAKKSALEQLHEMLTELFIEDIKICRSDGIPMSASDKAVIVKFLKDNDVTAAPDEIKVQALRDELQDELAAKREARLSWVKGLLYPLETDWGSVQTNARGLRWRLLSVDAQR